MWQAQGKALEVGMDRHGPRSCLVQGFSASAWLTFYAGSFLVVGDVLSIVGHLAWPLRTRCYERPPPSSCDDQKHLQTSPGVRWELEAGVQNHPP